MQIDISFLPALAAAFMLAFARVGTMVMLLPGIGESGMPVRVRLTIALTLTAILLPLHRRRLDRQPPPARHGTAAGAGDAWATCRPARWPRSIPCIGGVG